MWHAERQLYRLCFLELILSPFLGWKNVPVFDCLLFFNLWGWLMKQFHLSVHLSWFEKHISGSRIIFCFFPPNNCQGHHQIRPSRRKKQPKLIAAIMGLNAWTPVSKHFLQWKTIYNIDTLVAPKSHHSKLHIQKGRQITAGRNNQPNTEKKSNHNQPLLANKKTHPAFSREKPSEKKTPPEPASSKKPTDWTTAVLDLRRFFLPGAGYGWGGRFRYVEAKRKTHCKLKSKKNSSFLFKRNLTRKKHFEMHVFFKHRDELSQKCHGWWMVFVWYFTISYDINC